MEEDFTGGAIHDQPTRRQWSIDPPFDARVRQLVRDWDAKESPELIEEMIVTALTISRARVSVEGLRAISAFAKSGHFWIGAHSNRFTRVRSGEGFRSGNSGAQFHGGHRWR